MHALRSRAHLRDACGLESCSLEVPILDVAADIVDGRVADHGAERLNYVLCFRARRQLLAGRSFAAAEHLQVTDG